MKKPAALAFFLAWITLAGSGAAIAIEPKERVEHYDVYGTTAIELYRSIDENGPKLGRKRVIAYTDFKLLWSRDYRRQPDNSCKLVSSRPNLTITYRLPRARGPLPERTRKAWERFLAGITEHEKVHGRYIVELAEAIKAVSDGLTVPDDPHCRKIRKVLEKRLGELSREHRRRSSAFDRDEMRPGGNVHQLVLDLVNSDRM